MLNDDTEQQIQAVVLESDNEVLESESLCAGQGQNSDQNNIPTLASLAADAPTISTLSKGSEDFVCASEAIKMQDEEGLDMRPYLYDKLSKDYLLVDSGAAVTAIPPDPGDIPDPKMSLKAVNGTKLNCYGHKDIYIQINRKKYPIKAVKTDGRNNNTMNWSPWCK